MKLYTFMLLPSLVLAVTSAAVEARYDNNSTSSGQCESVKYLHKHRLFVLTDIDNEPDDQMSLVRLLTYSNEIDIKGITATTSQGLRNTTRAETIRKVVTAYGNVTANLNANVPTSGRYPSGAALLSKVYSGHPVFGLAALKLDPSEGAKNLIRATDEASPTDPLWVTIWGGANVLAEALNSVSKTRNVDEMKVFISSLRVYSISDQDDAGAWIRAKYPALFYIVSIHGYGVYIAATWTGISGEARNFFDKGGPDSSIVTNDWLQTHIQVGHLGKYYPNFTFIMEGDTPSFFPLIQNGLNYPEQPSWGGWGGRYSLVDISGDQLLYSNTLDQVKGLNGDTFVSPFASIWRWRHHYQHDFAARMQWTANGEYTANNHPPVAVVNGTCGSDPWTVHFSPGTSVVLDASGSWDPDNDELSFTWLFYQESTIDPFYPFSEESPFLNLTNVDDRGVTVSVKPNVEFSTYYAQARGISRVDFHIILMVTDQRDLNLTSYRRIVLVPS
ncbi:hypothetical protein F4859DRAFT_522804 [Xylaria cf. heliscus]|nr:hypothetical protein F4859DRAFT_522804 [Xylaria cf. heliscus]